jgi:NADH-quinone oxidoreductase subunit A
MLALIMTFAFAAAVAGALLVIPQLIAPRRLSAVKAAPFECGKDPLEIAEGRFAIKFGFAEMLVFLAILMLGFFYIWRKGGLEWE